MSVTAVPLRPLDRGTVPKLWIGILLLLAIGAGFAWLTTSRLQYTTTAEGLRYRVVSAGTGEPLGKDDLGRMDVELRGARGQILLAMAKQVDPQSGRVGLLVPITLERLPKPVEPFKDQLREGSVFQVFGPASALLGEERPPNVPANEQVEFRLHIQDIERNGFVQIRQRMSEERALRQQQMREQMAPGAPGGLPAGPPPRAIPPLQPPGR